MIHILDLHFFGLSEVIASFLIETSEGPVLVETGPHSTYPTIVKALADKGYKPEDVNHVFLSHIHLDHGGSAWAFAEMGATIYVHPFGEKHLHDPSKLMNSARMIYQDQMDVLWGEMRPIPLEKLYKTAHEEEIRVGELTLKALHTPGHAVHHIAWQAGDALFTGDVAGVKIREAPVVPPCPPPDIHVEDWQASLNLIRSLDISTLYLTHFGQVREVAAHLNELEARLLEWAEWMRPYYEKGTAPEEITPEFEAFVEKQLRTNSATDEHMKRYEYANPAWMSVAGLLRYWRKKE
jgi:glyoxylase-like metal-dependent hydrolase (beta-lactamase superfamily II)